MDNTVSFAELILKFWDTIIQYIWPLYFRNEGFYIIKKVCGKPSKIYKDEERWCWKLPLFQTFDVVDMRYQTFNCTAHSFIYNAEKIIPYNIVIDTQVEFRVKDPLIIYRLDKEALYSFVSNQVHQLLSFSFSEKASLDLNNLQKLVNEKLNQFKDIDKEFYHDIEISKIVITSYDYNISLRQIQ